MFYIVTEDSGSGLEFFKRVNDVVFDGCAVVRSSHGNTYFLETVLNIGLKECDCILCALDRVADAFVVKALEEIDKLSKLIGFKVVYTNYYCFEEFFLSFKFIEVWGRCDNNEVIQVCEFIRKCLYSGTADYYIKGRSTVLKKFTDISPQNVIRGREDFAHQLLAYVTKRSNKSFHISKSGKAFGKCWLTDCALVSKDGIYICKDCVLLHNMLCAKDKLEFLCKNSIDAVGINNEGVILLSELGVVHKGNLGY